MLGASYFETAHSSFQVRGVEGAAIQMRDLVKKKYGQRNAEKGVSLTDHVFACACVIEAVRGKGPIT